MSAVAFSPQDDERSSRAVWRGATLVGEARRIDGPGTSWTFHASEDGPASEALAAMSFDSLADLGSEVATTMKNAANEPKPEENDDEAEHQRQAVGDMTLIAKAKLAEENRR